MKEILYGGRLFVCLFHKNSSFSYLYIYIMTYRLKTTTPMQKHRGGRSRLAGLLLFGRIGLRVFLLVDKVANDQQKTDDADDESRQREKRGENDGDKEGDDVRFCSHGQRAELFGSSFDIAPDFGEQGLQHGVVGFFHFEFLRF